MNKFKKLSLLSLSVMTGFTGVLCGGTGDMSAYSRFVPKPVDVKEAVDVHYMDIGYIAGESPTVTASIDAGTGWLDESPDYSFDNGYDENYYSSYFDDQGFICLRVKDFAFQHQGDPGDIVFQGCSEIAWFNSSWQQMFTGSDMVVSYDTDFSMSTIYGICSYSYGFQTMNLFECDNGDVQNVGWTDADFVKLSNQTYSDKYVKAHIKDGGSKTLTYSVDANVSEASIVAGVSAKDLFGVDVAVKVKTSDYVVGKIGSFTIVLTATDSYGQTATATLHILVVDRTNPTINLNTSVSVPYGSSLTADEVLSHLSIGDNSGVDPSLTWVLPSGFEWGKALSFGSYNLGLTATDASGNKTSCTIPVNVYDSVAPVISRIDGNTTGVIKYGYSKSSVLSTAKVLSLFKATDEVCGACDVYVKSGSLGSGIGNWTLTLGAKDDSSNEGVLSVNVQIVADIPPVFILSDDLVLAQSDIKLSIVDLGQIAASLQADSGVSMAPSSMARAKLRPLMKGLTDVQINEDDFNAYNAGYDKVGSTYVIRYSGVDDDGMVVEGSFRITVVEDAAKTVPASDPWNSFISFFTKTIPDFISKLGKAFADLFQRIVNFFSFKGWNTDAELAPSSVPSSSASDPSVSE